MKVIVNFAQIVKKATCLTTLTQYNSNSLNELCSKKEILWMNSLTYRPRQKEDLWSKFRLGPKVRTSRQVQFGIRTKIRSWSTIHFVFKFRQSARLFTARKKKNNNPCAKLRRLIHTLCVSDSLRIYLFPLRRAAGIKKYPDSLSIRKPISPLGKQRLFLQAQAL